MDHHVERILSAAYTQNVDLKEWVRTERTRRGWTQERLADEAGLDRVEVNALEKGRNKGSSARIRDALTRVFGSIPPELGGATPVLAVVPDGSRPVYGNMAGWPAAEQVARTRPAAASLDERDFQDARGFSGVLAPHEVTPEFVLSLAMAAREVRLHPGPSALDKKIDAQMKADQTRYENRLAKQKPARADGGPLELTPPAPKRRKKGTGAR